MTSLGTMILWCMVQVTAFALLAAPAYLVARRLNARAGAMAALAALGIVIVLSLAAWSPFPRWGFGGGTVSAAGVSGGPLVSGNEGAAVDSTIESLNRETGQERTDSADPRPLVGQMWSLLQGATGERVASDVAIGGSAWPTIVVGAACVGVFFGLVRLAGGLVAVRRLVQRSRAISEPEIDAEVARIRRRLPSLPPIEIRESAETVTPATIGWRRGTVVLPASWRQWTEAERKAALAHELAHVARQDFAAWILGQIAVALHFYHPLVRWFARRLQLEQELSADDQAAQLVGNRTAYLHALAAIALNTPAHRHWGPARTLIPSKSLLLRRIEMLQATGGSMIASPRGLRAIRWLVIGLLAAVGIGVSGLRSPRSDSVQAAEPTSPAASESTPAAAEAKAYEFAYVPDNFIALFAMRPSAIAASPRLKAAAGLLDEALRPRFRSAELEQLTSVMTVPVNDDAGKRIPGSGSEFNVFRMVGPTDFKVALRDAYGNVSSEAVDGHEIITWGDNDHLMAFFAPNDRTLVGHAREGLRRVVGNPNAATPPAAATDWQKEATGPLFAIINPPALKMLGLTGGSPMQMLQPLFERTERLVITTVDSDPLVIEAKITCRTAEDVPVVEQTLRAAHVMAMNLLAAQRAAAGQRPQSSPPTPDQETEKWALDLAADVLKAVEVKPEGNELTVTATINDPETVIGKILMPAVMAARHAAHRQVRTNNLKQLALAAMMYHDMAGHYPPAVIYGKSVHGSAVNPTGDAATDVPRSWRVELLPLLDQTELYKQYRLDQPWDSPANKEVLAKMPVVFRAPEDFGGSTNAAYFALVGPGSVFEGREGARIQSITDGTSNTLLFAEAKRDIPWTKPEDIAYDPHQPAPKLGGWRDTGFLMALCDGSVHLVGSAAIPKIEKEILHYWIQKADGHPAPSPSELSSPTPAPGPQLRP